MFIAVVLAVLFFLSQTNLDIFKDGSKSRDPTDVDPDKLLKVVMENLLLVIVAFGVGAFVLDKVVLRFVINKNKNA